MNNFLHIDLQCTDADIAALERALKVQFQRIITDTVFSSSVEVYPMSSPSDKLDYVEMIKE